MYDAIHPASRAAYHSLRPSWRCRRRAVRLWWARRRCRGRSGEPGAACRAAAARWRWAGCARGRYPTACWAPVAGCCGLCSLAAETPAEGWAPIPWRGSVRSPARLVRSVRPPVAWRLSPVPHWRSGRSIHAAHAAHAATPIPRTRRQAATRSDRPGPAPSTRRARGRSRALASGASNHRARSPRAPRTWCEATCASCGAPLRSACRRAPKSLDARAATRPTDETQRRDARSRRGRSGVEFVRRASLAAGCDPGHQIRQGKVSVESRARSFSRVAIEQRSRMAGHVTNDPLAPLAQHASQAVGGVITPVQLALMMHI